MFTCTNKECIIETVSALVETCPLCSSPVVSLKEPEPEPEPMSLEEAEDERRYWLAIEAEERRMYGDPIEDFEMMSHRPSAIINEDGEPVGWG